MADTIRQLAAILAKIDADLPSQLDKAVTPSLLRQVLRDFAVSVMPTGRGATKVVASSTASDLQKAQADYVCDGTADEVQINLAIAALPAGGGKVVLTEGTFTTAAMVNLQNHCTLEGQGQDVTTLIGAAAYNNTLIENDYAGGHHTFFTLRNMTIDHGASKTVGVVLRFVQATDITLENLRIRRGGVMNVYFEHADVAFACKRIYVANCSIESSVANDGFSGDGIEDMRIVGCRSSGNAGYGFGMRASRRIEIVACSSDGDSAGVGFEGVTDSSINGFDCNAPTGVAGIYIMSDPNTTGISRDITVTAAHVTDAVNQGFAIDGDTTINLRIDLIGCSAIHCGYHGVRLEDCKEITVVGGHYLNNGVSGTAAGIGMVANVKQLQVIGVEASNTVGTYQALGVWDGDSATNDYVSVIGGSFRDNLYGGVALSSVVHKQVSACDGYVANCTGTLEGWVLDNAQNPILGVLPQFAIVTGVDVWVQEAFNSDGTNLLMVGYDALANAYVTALDVSTTGVKTPTMGSTVGAQDLTERQVEAYYVNGGTEPTTGRAHITIRYIIGTALPA
jgi:hypothetical protein